MANLLLKQTPEQPELGRAASRFVRPPSSFLPRVSGEMKRLVLDVGSELPPSGGRVRPDCEALAADWGRGDVAAVGAETPLRGGGLGGGSQRKQLFPRASERHSDPRIVTTPF